MLGRNLRLAGYEEAASECYRLVRRRRKVLPKSNNPLTSGIYEYVQWPWHRIALDPESAFRWNRDLQRYETMVFQAHAVKDRICGHDWHHVLDSLLRLESGDMTTKRRPEYTMPYRTQCNKGWTPVLVLESELEQARRTLESLKARTWFTTRSGFRWTGDDTLSELCHGVSEEILADIVSLG
jgi:hypothetical protein